MNDSYLKWIKELEEDNRAQDRAMDALRLRFDLIGRTRVMEAKIEAANRDAPKDGSNET